MATTVEVGKNGKTGDASSAPAVGTDDVVKKPGVVAAADVVVTPMFEKWTLGNQFLFSFLCSVMCFSVTAVNIATNSLSGQMLTCISTIFGPTLTVYHGMMDGPLRDSKTGDFLPTWKYLAYGQMCTFITSSNLAWCVFGHKQLGLYKLVATASCWVSVLAYMVTMGLWFLAPLHFIIIMSVLVHAQIFGFFIASRAFPLFMPYLVMFVNLLQPSLFGWSNRVHLDDVGSLMWASIICPLIAGYRRIAFMQIIAMQPWGMKIFLVISNILNAFLTPNVKTIMYNAIGMKVEVYDVNAMHMLDAISWSSDVKFLVMMPFLLLWGEAAGAENWGGILYPLFKANFGLIFGLYVLQFLCCEGAILSMKWASKFVNVRQAEVKRASVLQIGASKGTGRYYFSQCREDMKHLHPFMPTTMEVLQMVFTYYAIEDLYKL